MDGEIKVSIIIPARDAAATLGAALESLRAQTFAGWEAIVVDDGSVDGTAALACEAAARARDPRIRLAPSAGSGRGVSAARNTGLGLARGTWILFLDADDWIDPLFIERMMEALGDESLDGALCRWRLVAPDGRLGPALSCPSDRDLFGLMATYCAFAIHSCLVRRELVEAVGGFDPELTTCEEWDLWQRIARTGARFVHIPDGLAFYRMRSGSASRSPARLLADGLRVIARGHAPDPRVAGPAPIHAAGADRRGLPAASFLFACWAAGLALGCGEDARPLLAFLEGLREPGFDPEAAARSLFQAALLPGARLPEEWAALWPEVEEPLAGFLADLEARSGAYGLARRARRALERRVVEASTAPRPFTLGAIRAVRLEVTEPIHDLAVPAGVERVQASLLAGGEPLGHLELPVFGGVVPAAVLSDAVAADFSWEILRRFLVRRAPDHFGWDVFLQELWGRPSWSMATFYDPEAVSEKAIRQEVEGGWIEIEAAEELPELVLSEPTEAVLRIGGAVVGRVPLPEGSVLGAHALRAALTQAGGFEMCRVAVREGTLGRPFDAPGSLRDRLASSSRTGRDPYCGVVLGRHPGAPIGSSATRRARLPTEALPELLELAAALSQKVADHAAGDGWVTYDPELLSVREASPSQGASPSAPLASLYDRSHFETLFAAGPAPWHYTSPYEETKYEQTLSLLPSGPRCGERTQAPEIQAIDTLPPLPPDVAAHVLWQGGEPRPAGSTRVTTGRLPILMYHRVAPATLDRSEATARWRVAPAAFEEQLRYLRDAGFHTPRLEDWRRATEAKEPLPGRAVLLTFDDGTRDFAEHAWPLLCRYGFSALIFLVTDHIGGTNRWDAAYGEEVPLLGWDEIRRLRDEGAVFGSHAASHRPLTALSLAEAVREAARSRAVLIRGLGAPVDAIAYPYGAVDPAVRHLIGACGYVYGLSCRPGRGKLEDPLLDLPRIEVAGTAGFDAFVRGLADA